ncbi:MAG: ribosome silencing factor [Opitutales bacterium]
MQEQHTDTLDQINRLCAALDDKKASDVRILDLTGKSDITNYFVVASGTSEPHLKALAGHLDRTCKDIGIDVVAIDNQPSSGWLVLDAFDFMVHLFLPSQRETYQLEQLWKDAPEVDRGLLLTA